MQSKNIKTFRKSVFVASVVQNKKTSKVNSLPISENSDSDNLIEARKKIKKKSKTTKNKLQKAATEVKF